MAVDLCPENSGLVMSPRISFSHYLSQYDVVPVDQRLFRSTSSSGNIDFDFCVRESYEQESSSADELFSGGKILPTQIKNKTPPSPPPNQTHDQSEPQQPCERRDNENSCEGESSKETTKATSAGSDEKQNQNANSKSFWRFKRSNSLNCGNGYGPSLCPLQILSRSNSTGSTSVKRSNTLPKHNHHTQKQNSQKISLFASSSKSLKSSSSLSWGNHQKPPLKKRYCGSYHGNSNVGVNPVLNVHYGNLFCLGSIFFTGKDKNKKK